MPKKTKYILLKNTYDTGEIIKHEPEMKKREKNNSSTSQKSP